MKREFLARSVRWLVLGFILSVASAAGASAADLVLYDNFDDTARLSPDKWFGSETRRTNSTLEASRYIAGDKLRLVAVGYGNQQSNRGRQTGNFGLGIRTTQSITAIQAEMTVTSTMAQSCRENSHPSQARAQLVGFFFKDGSGGATGDLTGYVVALIEKVVDSHDGNFIRALVLRCASSGCSKGESIKALLFKRKWTLNEADILRVEWKPSAFQFVFTVNPDREEAETLRIAYDKAIGPSKPPERQLQRIRVRHHSANCESGRLGALINVAVDDVYLGFLDPKVFATLTSKTASSAKE